MDYFTLPNNIFDRGLKAYELLIYAYLCSCVGSPRIGGKIVCVRQRTIAEKCGYNSVTRVGRIISALAQKGLVQPIKRRSGGLSAASEYFIASPANNRFFTVRRSIFATVSTGGISKSDFTVYLYLSRCADSDGRSFPSIRGMAAACGLSCTTVIAAVTRLTELGFISKRSRRRKNGAFARNLYIRRAVVLPRRRYLSPTRRSVGVYQKVIFIFNTHCKLPVRRKNKHAVKYKYRHMLV